MKYKASVHLKQADTAGRVPASILDGFVREELLRQIGTALKPHIPVHQADFIDDSQSATTGAQLDFTTELVILPGEQWHQLREQLGQWCHDLPADKTSQLQALLDGIDGTTNENPVGSGR